MLESWSMKKNLLVIIVCLLKFSNLYADDTLIGKWVNEKTSSVYEIKKSNGNYNLYLLFSTKFFKEHKDKLMGSFKKTNLGYKGNFIATELKYPWTETDAKATYKLKEGKLLKTVKGNFEGKKFKFKETYIRAPNKIKYILGEELFGVQIGKTIDNYKLGSFILVGDKKFKVRKRIIYPPKPHESFGTYLIRYHRETKQIFEIDGYLKLNSRNLGYTQCRNVMQPYKNYAKDKYAGKFELGSNSYGNVLVKNGYEVYRIFIGCDEREGNHIGYISLNHKDLSMHDFSQRNKVPTNKKKF